jgi:hypothetical protein
MAWVALDEAAADVVLVTAKALGVAEAWVVEVAAAAFPALFLFEKWKILLTKWPMERKWTILRNPLGGVMSDLEMEKRRNERLFAKTDDPIEERREIQKERTTEA